MQRKGGVSHAQWRLGPFWAALFASLLVLVPLVGGTSAAVPSAVPAHPAAGRLPTPRAVCPSSCQRPPTSSLCCCASPASSRASCCSTSMPGRTACICSGAACGAAIPFGQKGRPAGPVLCRGRPSPLPGSLIGASGSARGPPAISPPLPQRLAAIAGPVRDAAGGLFRRAHRRRAGPVAAAGPFRAFPPGTRRSLFSGWAKADPPAQPRGLPPGRRCGTRFFRQDLELLPTTLPDALRASSSELLTDLTALDY